MAETSQPTRSSKDPVRIVYHAGNRTFARLFKEHSLAEVKDVVRHKLGLGADTDVSLKQIGPGMLLDLEDDGDFQAFRVFIKSSESVDIKVTVGRSQGSAVPAPAAHEPQKHTAAFKPTAKTTLAASCTEEPVGAATSSQPSASSKASTVPAVTPLARKRKVSFDHSEDVTSEMESEGEEDTNSSYAYPALRRMPLRAARIRAEASFATSNERTRLQSDGPTAHPEVTRSVETPTTSARKPRPKTPTRPLAWVRVPLPSKTVRGGLTASAEPTEQHSDKPIVDPEVTREVETLVASDRPTEQRELIATTPIVSKKPADSTAGSKPEGTEEPPKKKRKKESAKKRDGETTEIVENPSVKSSALKTKPGKTASGSKTTAPKDTETSEPPAKKQRKLKKDGDTGSKKPSASVDQDGTGQGMNQPSDPANKAQPVVEKASGSNAEGDTLQTHMSDKTDAPVGVCASIPQTSASITIRSEVAAAILSSYLFKPSEPVPPKPPAKRKYVRRAPKKSSALPREPPVIPGPPANETPKGSADNGSEQVVLADGPCQTTGPNGRMCPICLGEPFHIRYCCPTVLKGPDAIRERLEELEKANTNDQQSLIKQLQGLLRDSEATSMPSLDVASTGVLSNEVSPPNISLPRTPNIPSNSCLSEVTVESRDEGSSSESSDEMSDGGVHNQELSVPQRQKTPDDQSSPSSNELDAVIRGPASKQQSILNLIDRIVEDEDDEDSSEDEAELEEDPDEEVGRSRHRSSRHTAHSSESEDEEESRSPSPSLPAQGSNSCIPIVQSSSKPAVDSAGRQEEDVVMKGPVNPPILDRQHDDSGEETHVGSEDHMLVDESTGDKSATNVTEEQSSSPVPKSPLLQPLDVPSNEARESAKTQVELTPNREGSIPAASEVLKDAEVDPIEPADDPESPSGSHSPNVDPIEAPFDDTEPLSAGMTQSTPKPGVSKRIKTRNGMILDDESERPVLLEQLASEAADEVTPVPATRKSRNKATATLTSLGTRKSPRLSSSTRTPATVALRRLGASARRGRVAKTPAKASQERSNVSKSGTEGDAVHVGTIVATPSLDRWETLVEPTSPSLQQSQLVDELVSSSPQPNGALGSNGKENNSAVREPVAPDLAESSQEKERLFDPSSQNLVHSERAASSDETGGEETDDDDEEEEEEPPKTVQRKGNVPARYRSLSQLASNATLFSPSFPTPGNKSVTNGRGKKRVADEESSSSSSSSDDDDDDDDDEATGSKHIPWERRAWKRGRRLLAKMT